MKFKAVVEIKLEMEKEESFAEAHKRLFNLLFNNISCNENVSCDFYIKSTEEVDE